MAKLNYQASMNEKLLTKEEELEAIERWQQHRDPKALEKLILSHARIAFSKAGRFTKNLDHIEDLAAEGVMGIMVAADKFDKKHNTRFATYCKWWVGTKISQGVPKVATTIAIPSRAFINARSGRPDDGKNERAYMAVHGTIELDANLTSEGGLSAMDMMASTDPTPEEAAIDASNTSYYQEMLQKALDSLRPNEREVIMRRKLHEAGEDGETLEDIAITMGVTRERVRQIESKAMSKLKVALLNGGFRPDSLRADS